LPSPEDELFLAQNAPQAVWWPGSDRTHCGSVLHKPLVGLRARKEGEGRGEKEGEKGKELGMGRGRDEEGEERWKGWREGVKGRNGEGEEWGRKRVDGEVERDCAVLKNSF